MVERPGEAAMAVAIQLAESWNARDLTRFLSFLTEDVEWDDPAMQQPARGRAAVEQFAKSVLEAFPDFEYKIREPICVASDESRCAVPWRITATHTERWEPPGYGPTNRTVDFEGVDLLEFRGPQVCRIETLFDVVGAAGQLLGLTLRPPVGGMRERVAVLGQRARAYWLREVRGH